MTALEELSEKYDYSTMMAIKLSKCQEYCTACSKGDIISDISVTIPFFISVKGELTQQINSQQLTTVIA